MTDLAALESWAGALLQKLSPQERKAVTRKVGQALRASQRQRIAAQRAPDGSAYAPRSKKKGFRQKVGTVRRKAMFTKIRTAKFMRVDASDREVGVGFSGRVAAIAQVHQSGARRRSRSTGRTYVTPRRELLGLSDSDIEIVRDALLEHLAT